jgi:hypothetical protein
LNSDLVCIFKNRQVQVVIEGYRVSGVLTAFLDSPMGESCLMILFSNGNLTLVKGNFESLGEVQNEK